MQGNAVTCFHCNTEHPAAHHARVVYNKTPLYGPWAGWRMAGRDLVSPDGDRINPQRLTGLLWAERARARIGKAVCKGESPTPRGSRHSDQNGASILAFPERASP